jgi:hypothetical protein
MKMLKIMPVLALMAISILGSKACAQTGGSLDLSWHTIAGGGGSCAAAHYALTGTIGQADAASASSATCTLVGGFWASEAAISAPQGPYLQIKRSGSFVIISWPAEAGASTLQSAGDLTSHPNWTAVAQPLTLAGSQYQVTLSATNAKQFFRLARQ